LGVQADSARRHVDGDPVGAEVRLQLANVLHVQGSARGAQGRENRLDGVVRQLGGEQTQPESEGGREVGRSDVGRDAVLGTALQPGRAAQAGLGGRRPAVARRALAAALLLAAGTAGTAAHDPITTKVTFDREIRAILQTRCASCHAPGAPAPMPLATYDEVRPWARAIKDQILTRRMPIWHAAHGYGAVANDPSLRPAELAVIA